MVQTDPDLFEKLGYAGSRCALFCVGVLQLDGENEADEKIGVVRVVSTI